MEKTKLLSELNKTLLRDAKTFFNDDGLKLVLGNGHEDSPVVMVGEAPGKNEVIEGKPFVGAAGKNLDRFLEATGIKRDELYITNTVKIRPYKISPAGNQVNRAPSNGEITFFLPYLKKELGIISPKIIVTLGNVPLFALTGKKNISEVHGRLMGNLFPLYHPAAVIYNRALNDTYLNDLNTLNEVIRDII